MGNSNALMQNFNASGFQQNHEDGCRVDDNHCHNHGAFPIDLNYEPVPMDNYHHDHHHHNGPQNNGDEPMVPFNQVIPFPDLNMMPEEGDGSGAASIADVDDKGEEKVVEAQPAEASGQETNRAHTKIPMVKRQWSLQEDMRLKQLVKRYGVKRWPLIAQKLGGRVGKQCKERWNNNLRSNIKKGEWSLEEDMILVEAHKKFGNKWRQIAKHLPGRTDNTIKNRWHATLRKKSSPRGGTDVNGSNLLWNYIRSVTSSSLLAKNDNTNKRKNAADHSNRLLIRNLNLELPPGNENGDQMIGPEIRNLKLELPPGNENGEQMIGPEIRNLNLELPPGNENDMPCLLFGHDLTDYAGTSKDNLGAVGKEIDFLGMISHRRA